MGIELGTAELNSAWLMIITLLSSGGLLSAILVPIIKHILNKRRNLIEDERVKIESESTSLQNILDFEGRTYERYTSTMKKLEEAEKEIQQAKLLLLDFRTYIIELRRILENQGTRPPYHVEFDEVKRR